MTFLLFPVPYSWGGAIFQITAFGLAYWWFRATPPPGFAVAALGIAAVVMAIRGNRFTRGEEIAWIVIAFCFFIVEIRAITKDRTDNEKQQAQIRYEETQHFEATLQQYQEQFKATMAEVETSRKISKGVSTLEKQAPPSLKSETTELVNETTSFLAQRATGSSQAVISDFRARYQDDISSIVPQLRLRRAFDYPACRLPLMTLADINDCVGALQLAAKRLP